MEKQKSCPGSGLISNMRDPHAYLGHFRSGKVVERGHNVGAPGEPVPSTGQLSDFAGGLAKPSAPPVAGVPNYIFGAPKVGVPTSNPGGSVGTSVPVAPGAPKAAPRLVPAAPKVVPAAPKARSQPTIEVGGYKSPRSSAKHGKGMGLRARSKPTLRQKMKG